MSTKGAADKLRRERAQMGPEHPSVGFRLDRLGTHSFKYTGVCIMKDVCSSTALVGAVAGTTARALDHIYDAATMARQIGLVTKAFDDLSAADPELHAIFAQK